MITRSPCEAYLKYLIVHPDGFTDEQVRNLTEAQHLDYVGGPYMARLRAICIPPNPFYPENSAHMPSTRFLLKEKLEDIFRPDKDMRIATRLVDQPRAKDLIETMLITHASFVWIRTALKRIGVEATIVSLELYRFYYFNLKILNADELKSILAMRGEPQSTSDPYEQRFNRHYAAAVADSESLQAARMAVTPFAGIMQLMRHGIMPPNVEVNKLVAATRLAALVRTSDSLHTNDPDKARDYAFIAKMMSEIAQDVGDVEEGLQEGLTKLILKTDTRALPNIKELSDGSHTLDLQPIEAEGETIDVKSE